jgi:adenylate kinase family enzyme
MRVHVLGASGAGVTTLGRALAQSLDVPAFDADDFYWLPSDPPYQNKRPVPDRIRLLLPQLERQESWVLSGSMVKWSAETAPLFTHIVFVTLDNNVRMRRIAARELARFGARVEPGGDMHAQSQDFLAYCALYESGRLDMRTRAVHERWLLHMDRPILRLDSIEPVVALVQKIIPWLEAYPYHAGGSEPAAA